MPSMYHRCLKAIWKDKKVHLNISECPFQTDEAHFIELVLFYELIEDCKVVPTGSRGVPLRHGRPRGTKIKLDEIDSMFSNPPWSSK